MFFVTETSFCRGFFSRFKTELVEGGVFENIGQARSEIFSYIEG
ncbi:MAG: IS3 family transposase [Blastocatellia bacterium]